MSGWNSGRCSAASEVRSPIIEMGPRLVQREDEDVSAAIQEILRGRRHPRPPERQVHRLFQARRRDRRAGGLRQEPNEITGTHLLLAVGRRPNTDDLGLDKAGVELDQRGYIVVDDQLRTNVPGIWAMGDCNGRGAFTHTSYNDSRSSPPTSWTTTRAASATASLRTRSTSTRRSDEPA